MKIDLQNHWGERELYYTAELTSKIIDSMQTDGSVYLWTKEAKNGEHNGLYDLLDNLCAYWSWDKSKITISTSNFWTPPHPEYKIFNEDLCHPAGQFDITDPISPEWNNEKFYGMFIGRADVNRIRAIHNHKNFKYSNKGLTSFHSDLFNFMSKPDLVDYFMHSGQTYQEMISVKPYSDIDKLRVGPITYPHNSIGWSSIYEKIAIEVVCEVTTQPNNPELSEKLIRPMFHKRPFLLISSPRNLNFLHTRGFKTFKGIIPEDYDQLQGIPRVDRVFDILLHLIDNGNIHSIIKQSHDILEHNHNLVVELCKVHNDRI